MSRLIVMLASIAGASGVAMYLRRRRPAPPTQPRWAVPTQLDRADFEGPGAPWLLAVFTSSACESCERVTVKAAVLASDSLEYQEISYQERRDLHERYGVEAVPTVLLADAEGVVRVSYVGVPAATDLWAAVADARQMSS